MRTLSCFDFASEIFFRGKLFRGKARHNVKNNRDNTNVSGGS